VINFRYHVVSLAAVFFALAIGLVVGTAAFNGPAAEQLGDQVDSMSRQNTALRDENNHLKDEAENVEKFAAESIPYLVDDKLDGKRILLITTSDADKDYIDGMLEALDVAGAKVTGRITLLKKFVDPASKEELLDLADLTVPPGVTGLPANSNGVETSSALLAAALVDRSPPMSADDRRKVITAYRDAGYLIPSPEVIAAAEAAETVLLLTGAPYAEKDASRLNGALKFVVEQFDKSGPLVVAGSSTGGDGNLVVQVRGDSTLSKQVSTVDNAASPQGRAAALLALADQMKGTTGHYGVGSGASGLLPKDAGVRPRNGS
jgi:hypothetical protein